VKVEGAGSPASGEPTISWRRDRECRGGEGRAKVVEARKMAAAMGRVDFILGMGGWRWDEECVERVKMK
jgi:hypothetical protein